METIENMWQSNSDGAGFMYPYKGQIFIEKGFMTLKNLKKALENLENRVNLYEIPLVLHFRITTSGGTKADNCHPFPVVETMGMLKKHHMVCDMGLAHNGIIDIKHPADVSDTMAFVVNELAPIKKAKGDFHKNPHMRLMLENRTGSKLAIMDKSGHVELVGKFDEDGGCYYSNTTYKWGYYGTTRRHDYPLWKYMSELPTGSTIHYKNGRTCTVDFPGWYVDYSGGIYYYNTYYDSALKISNATYATAPDGKTCKYDYKTSESLPIGEWSDENDGFVHWE
jgi:hypothetical protein